MMSEREEEIMCVEQKQLKGGKSLFFRENLEKLNRLCTHAGFYFTWRFSWSLENSLIYNAFKIDGGNANRHTLLAWGLKIHIFMIIHNNNHIYFDGWIPLISNLPISGKILRWESTGSWKTSRYWKNIWITKKRLRRNLLPKSFSKFSRVENPIFYIFRFFPDDKLS